MILGNKWSFWISSPAPQCKIVVLSTYLLSSGFQSSQWLSEMTFYSTVRTLVIWVYLLVPWSFWETPAVPGHTQNVLSTSWLSLIFLDDLYCHLSVPWSSPCWSILGLFRFLSFSWWFLRRAGDCYCILILFLVPWKSHRAPGYQNVSRLSWYLPSEWEHFLILIQPLFA